eukprot:m.130351 g.130351  ORF g.130351 m.130351 type:complete len:748 (+) comp15872_c0_seq1:360-2603(+)
MPFRFDRFAKQAFDAVSDAAGSSASTLQQAVSGHKHGHKHKKKHHKEERRAPPPTKEETAAVLEELIQDEPVVRFRAITTGRFLRTHNLEERPESQRVDGTGGKGRKPYMKLTGDSRYEVNLQSKKTGLYLHLSPDGARPSVGAEPSPVYIDANDDGTVSLLVPGGKYCLAVPGMGAASMVESDGSRKTRFIMMLGDDELKLADDDSVEPPSYADDEMDEEELMEEFGTMIELPVEDQRQRALELNAEQRNRWHEYLSVELRNKADRKRHRHTKRGDLGLPVDEDKFQADIQGLEQACNTILCAAVDPSVPEPELPDFESSDDGMDDDEWEAQMESIARLKDEAAAAAKAEAAEALRLAEEQRLAAEAKLAEMQAQQAILQQQAEEAMAAAAEAAAQKEAEAEAAEEEAEEDAGSGSEIEDEDSLEKLVDVPAPTPAMGDNPDFNAEETVRGLYKAFKGIGCDRKAVCKLLLTISNKQRLEVKIAYKATYGKDLMAQIKSELGGNFKKLVVAAIREPAVFDAKTLRHAMKGLGTSEYVLLEVICTRSVAQLAAIKETYERLFDRDLEKDVMSETSGSVKRLLVSLLAGGRSQSTEVDHEKAKKEAGLLRQNVALWGRDESVLNQILCVRSPVQIRATLKEYETFTGQDLCVKLKRNLGSKLGTAYMTIIGCARNPARFFAEQIFKAFAGLGMDEEKIIRIFVSRSEVDMGTIAELYPAFAETSLKDEIHSEAKSDFRRGLNALAGIE